MSKIERFLSDPRYQALDDAGKKEKLDLFFNKYVTQDARYSPLDEEGKARVYSKFMSKYYGEPEAKAPKQKTPFTDLGSEVENITSLTTSAEADKLHTDSVESYMAKTHRGSADIGYSRGAESVAGEPKPKNILEAMDVGFTQGLTSVLSAPKMINDIIQGDTYSANYTQGVIDQRLKDAGYEDMDMASAIKNKDLKKAGGMALKVFSQSAPVTALWLVHPLIGDVFGALMPTAASKYTQLDREMPELSTGKKVASAALAGTWEALSEEIGNRLGFMNKFVKIGRPNLAKLIAKEVAKTKIIKAFAGGAMGAVGEGFEEYLSFNGEYWTDVVLGITDHDPKAYREGAINSTLLGIGAGGVQGGITTTVSSLLNARYSNIQSKLDKVEGIDLSRYKDAGKWNAAKNAKMLAQKTRDAIQFAQEGDTEGAIQLAKENLSAAQRILSEDQSSTIKAIGMYNAIIVDTATQYQEREEGLPAPSGVGAGEQATAIQEPTQKAAATEPQSVENTIIKLLQEGDIEAAESTLNESIKNGTTGINIPYLRNLVNESKAVAARTAKEAAAQKERQDIIDKYGEYADMSHSELQDEAKKRGLKAGGKSTDIMARLKESDQAKPKAETTPAKPAAKKPFTTNEPTEQQQDRAIKESLIAEEAPKKASKYESMSYNALQKEAKKHGINSFGVKKAELIRQLEEKDASTEKTKAERASVYDNSAEIEGIVVGKSADEIKSALGAKLTKLKKQGYTSFIFKGKEFSVQGHLDVLERQKREQAKQDKFLNSKSYKDFIDRTKQQNKAYKDMLAKAERKEPLTIAEAEGFATGVPKGYIKDGNMYVHKDTTPTPVEAKDAEAIAPVTPAEDSKAEGVEIDASVERAKPEAELNVLKKELADIYRTLSLLKEEYDRLLKIAPDDRTAEQDKRIEYIDDLSKIRTIRKSEIETEIAGYESQKSEHPKPEAKAPKPQSYTEDNLRTMGFDQIENYKETVGVGKYKGKTWRTAEYEAVNDRGEIHKYEVKVDNDGIVKVKDKGKAKQQIEIEDAAQYKENPEQIRAWIDQNLPNINDYLKNKIAEFMLGGKKGDKKKLDHTVLATVFTPNTRERLSEFSNLTMKLEIASMLKQIGDRVLSAEDSKAEVAPKIQSDPMSRSTFQEQYRQAQEGKLPKGQIDAQLKLYDAMMDTYAKEMGITIDEAYAEVIDSVTADEPLDGTARRSGARYQAVEEKNLVTIHNIPADSIEKVNNRGGMVMPSIAIIDATKTKFTGFGDASLIGDEKMIQPSAKQPLYTSDAYTPTYPKVYEIVKMDKNLEALAEYLSKKTKKKVTTWDLETNIEDQGSERYVASLLYGVMDYRKAQKEAIRTLEKHPINIEEKIFAGYTRNGQRRYIPHTVENALRIMRKDSKDDPSTFWGTSSLRGALAAKFSSLAQAKKNRDMILSKAEMEQIEEATDKMFEDIAARANAVRKNQRAFYHSDIASDIYDMARYGWGRIADWYKDDSIKEDFRSFISHLRSLPTQYFEYKPQRVVGINEFVAAVIPTGTKASTAKALRDAGLKVVRYEAGNDEARFEAVKKVSEEMGVRFQTIQGYIQKMPNGKYRIGIMQPNVTTGLHEQAHLGKSLMEIMANKSPAWASRLKAAEEWCGVKDGKWTTEAEEKFANGYVKFLADGSAPNGKLKTIFAKIKEWIGSILQGLADVKNLDVSNEMRGVYLSMLGISEGKRNLTSEQKVQSIKLKSAMKQDATSDPLKLETEIDSFADSNDLILEGKRTGNKTSFYLNRIDDGKTMIEIHHSKGEYEVNGYHAANNQEVMEQVTRILGDTRYQTTDIPSAAEIAEAERQMAEVRAKYEGTDQWLKAPNGKPTKLNERQWLQVRTENFKKWFGDWENDPKNASKVVDENGEPMVVYHGQRSIGKFTEFDPGYIFFSKSEEVAKRFKEESAYELSIDGIRHPITKEEALRIGEAYDPWDIDGIFGYNLSDMFEWDEMSGVRDYLKTYWSVDEAPASLSITKQDDDIFEVFLNIRNPKTKNYDGKIWGEEGAVIEHDIDESRDGYIAQNIVEGGIAVEEDFPLSDTYVVFSPTQIKSATGNVGTFSESRDIRYQIDNAIQSASPDMQERIAKIMEKQKKVQQAANATYRELTTKIGRTTSVYEWDSLMRKSLVTAIRNAFPGAAPMNIEKYAALEETLGELDPGLEDHAKEIKRIKAQLRRMVAMDKKFRDALEDVSGFSDIADIPFEGLFSALENTNPAAYDRYFKDETFDILLKALPKIKTAYDGQFTMQTLQRIVDLILSGNDPNVGRDVSELAFLQPQRLFAELFGKAGINTINYAYHGTLKLAAYEMEYTPHLREINRLLMTADNNRGSAYDGDDLDIIGRTIFEVDGNSEISNKLETIQERLAEWAEENNAVINSKDVEEIYNEKEYLKDIMRGFIAEWNANPERTQKIGIREDYDNPRNYNWGDISDITTKGGKYLYTPGNARERSKQDFSDGLDYDTNIFNAYSNYMYSMTRYMAFYDLANYVEGSSILYASKGGKAGQKKMASGFDLDLSLAQHKSSAYASKMIEDYVRNTIGYHKKDTPKGRLLASARTNVYASLLAANVIMTVLNYNQRNLIHSVVDQNIAMQVRKDTAFWTGLFKPSNEEYPTLSGIMQAYVTANQSLIAELAAEAKRSANQGRTALTRAYYKHSAYNAEMLRLSPFSLAELGNRAYAHAAGVYQVTQNSMAYKEYVASGMSRHQAMERALSEDSNLRRAAITYGGIINAEVNADANRAFSPHFFGDASKIKKVAIFLRYGVTIALLELRTYGGARDIKSLLSPDLFRLLTSGNVKAATAAQTIQAGAIMKSMLHPKRIAELVRKGQVSTAETSKNLITVNEVNMVRDAITWALDVQAKHTEGEFHNIIRGKSGAKQAMAALMAFSVSEVLLRSLLELLFSLIPWWKGKKKFIETDVIENIASVLGLFQGLKTASNVRLGSTLVPDLGAYNPTAKTTTKALSQYVLRLTPYAGFANYMGKVFTGKYFSDLFWDEVYD